MALKLAGAVTGKPAFGRLADDLLTGWLIRSFRPMLEWIVEQQEAPPDLKQKARDLLFVLPGREKASSEGACL